MAQKGIREYDGKALLSKCWDQYFGGDLKFSFKSVLVSKSDDLRDSSKVHSWLSEESLVVKPDMLFGNRGKNNLVYFKTKKPGDVTVDDAIRWLDQKTNEVITLKKGATGTLDQFIVEPFIPHASHEEYYISVTSEDDHDCIHLSVHGGVDVDSNWDKMTQIMIPLDASDTQINDFIADSLPAEMKHNPLLATFTSGFYKFFRDLHFAYLEVNPFVLKDHTIYILDMVAKCDDTAGFLMREYWGDLEFPTAFGSSPLGPEEKKITEMDEKSGASLKLTLLNPEGRIWLLVAGGGASVVYSDTISNTWGINELANYGEYSGNPSTEETYEYANTLFKLMTQAPDKDSKPKILLIGGAIANFTDVAKTFKGIIMAFKDNQEGLRNVNTKIFVRRGGPNYKLGLHNIKKAANEYNLDMEVYGAETHMTDIIRMSFEKHA